jgi:hypothetical protein
MKDGDQQSTRAGSSVSRWSRRALFAFFSLGALGFGFHALAHELGAMQHAPPVVEKLPRSDRGPLRIVGKSSALRRQGIWEVHLEGTPAEIGWAHAQLLRDRMLVNEGILQSALHKTIPSRFLRALVLDWAALEYRGLDDELSASRKSELATAALAFQPDPFSGLFPTYQRFVYLNSLYDISLSLEHSPLVGCTTFTVPADQSSTGGPLLARAFDFEVDEIFDTDKAVFFVKEEGKIPFASVAWPGLVGVVTGMNAFGLSVVVHGARAGPVVTEGTPVLHAMRRVLSEAKTTAEALSLLEESPPLVSHMVILQDTIGDAVVVERSVHRAGYRRSLTGVSAVTNHFEGPLNTDEKNQRVRQTTSTLARRARAEALIKHQKGLVSPERLVEWLRDRKDEQGDELPLGDRNAIDALIATHAVVFDTKSRTLWVSRGPRMMGAFVQIRLEDELLEPFSVNGVRPQIAPDPERDALLQHLSAPSAP